MVEWYASSGGGLTHRICVYALHTMNKEREGERYARAPLYIRHPIYVNPVATGCHTTDTWILPVNHRTRKQMDTLDCSWKIHISIIYVYICMILLNDATWKNSKLKLL